MLKKVYLILVSLILNHVLFWKNNNNVRKKYKIGVKIKNLLKVSKFCKYCKNYFG